MIKVIEKIDDKIDLIQMKNDDLEVVVSNYGCTIVKVLMKDKDGNIDDVVLGMMILEIIRLKTLI